MDISPSLFTNLSRWFRLNQTQELIFALALRHSTHEDLQRLAEEHLQESLPDFVQRATDGMGVGNDCIYGLFL